MADRIASAAQEQVANAHPGATVKFVLWLNEPIPTEPEVDAIRAMACSRADQSVRVDAIEVSACCLLELARLPLVVMVS